MFTDKSTAYCNVLLYRPDIIGTLQTVASKAASADRAREILPECLQRVNAGEFDADIAQGQEWYSKQMYVNTIVSMFII